MIKTIVDYKGFQKDLQINTELLKEMYLTFMYELNCNKDSMNRCYQRNDYVWMMKYVHNIKGLSGTYRARKVSRIAEALYHNLRKNEKIIIGYYAQALNEVIDETIFEMKSYFDEEPKRELLY